MIDCEIYIHSKEKEGPVRIGSKPFSQFRFNSLPREGDVLWLQYDENGEHVQRSVVVTFSAQWCSDLVDNNHGYIEVARPEIGGT